MANKPRYSAPADNTRPYKSHRYDVFGPKVQRRLTLFGELSMIGFILLEADSDIASYCERPILIEELKPKRVVDFWVQRKQSEELWFLLRPSELKWLDQKRVPTSAFHGWAESKGFNIRLIPPGSATVSDTLIRNWAEIIQYLSANSRYLENTISQKVIHACREPSSVGAVEQALLPEDPILVRTAVFRLIHSGMLRANGLDESPISADTRLEPL